MQNSTRRSISYPVAARSDAPDIPAHFANLIAALDLDIPYTQGLLSARPATPTYQGQAYFATDTGVLYIWANSAWRDIAPLTSPALAGTPTSVTPSSTDNSTKIATTAFVRTILPAGVMMAYGGAAAPSGWYLCDGSLKNRTTDAALFSAIGTAYGAGDGSTTFGIPDLRGRIPVGKDTGTFATLGATGGVQTVALAVANLPSHTHSGTTGTESANHTHSGNTGGRSAAHTHSGTVDSAGAHSHGIHTIQTPGGIVDFGWQNVTGSSQIVINTDSAGAHQHTFTTGTESADHTHGFTSGTQSANHTHSFTTDGGAGTATAFTNLQPYQVVNWIIKN